MFRKLLYILISCVGVFGQDCGLILPPNPLSPVGLSTPYVLISLNEDYPCSVLIPETTAFVEATILDLDTGDLSVYYPLVVDNIDQVAVEPIVPILPVNSLVGLWMNSQSRSMRLVIISENDANCVDGDIFGKYAYCNADEFFKKANNLILKGVLKIPQIGNSNTGEACPTVRHFGVIQPYSTTSVLSSYIITKQYKVAQNTRENQKNLNVLDVINSGTNTLSTNRLLVSYVNPAIECKGFSAPNLIDSSDSWSIALNELSANVYQKNPIVLVSSGDKPVIANGKPDLYKFNLYRTGLNQPVVSSIDTNDMISFCDNLKSIAGPFLFKHYYELSTSISPDETISINLVNFLAYNFVKNWKEFSCNGESPITVVIENGMVVSNNIQQKYGSILKNDTKIKLVYFLSIFFSILVILILIVGGIIYYKKTKNTDYRHGKLHV